MTTLCIDQDRIDAVRLDLPLPPVDALGAGAAHAIGRCAPLEHEAFNAAFARGLAQRGKLGPVGRSEHRRQAQNLGRPAVAGCGHRRGGRGGRGGRIRLARRSALARCLTQHALKLGAPRRKRSIAPVLASRFEQVVGHKDRRRVTRNRGGQRLAGDAPLQGSKGQWARAGDIPGQDLAIEYQAVEVKAIGPRAVEGWGPGQLSRSPLDFRKALGDQFFTPRPEPDLLAPHDQLRPNAVPLPLDLPVLHSAKRCHLALKRMRKEKGIRLAAGREHGHAVGHRLDQCEITLCIRHPAGVGIADHALRDQGCLETGDFGQGSQHQLFRYAHAKTAGDQLVERKAAIPVEL